MRRKEGSYLTAGTLWRFVFAAFMLTIFFVTRGVFVGNPQYADAYQDVTKAIAMILSGALSYISFTVAELLIFLILTVILLYLAISVYQMCVTHEVLPRLWRMLANLLAFGSAVLMLFFVMFGTNYYCSPLSERMELPSAEELGQEELILLTTHMRDQANAFADMVPRDLEGYCEFGSFSSLAGLVPMGYQVLSEEYRFLDSTYAPVKGIATGQVVASFGITGIYFPFTGECLVVPERPDQSILFTMAHETAHRLAIAPEDEANFIAFLSCRANTDRRVAYSGYFMAYIYCINALYDVDADAAREIQSGVNNNLAIDIAQHNESVRSHDGFLSDVGDAVNDTYLKSLGQENGTESYDKMVMLLLAEYKGELYA